VCNSDPVPYDMGSVAHTPYGGSCCLRSCEREEKSLAKKTEENFRQVAHLLTEWVQMRTVDQPIERWLGPQIEIAGRQRKLPQLFGYWQDLLATPAPDARNSIRHIPRFDPALPRREMTIASNSIQINCASIDIPIKQRRSFQSINRFTAI
jgi:hypothetical protein